MGLAIMVIAGCFLSACSDDKDEPGQGTSVANYRHLKKLTVVEDWNASNPIVYSNFSYDSSNRVVGCVKNGEEITITYTDSRIKVVEHGEDYWYDVADGKVVAHDGSSEKTTYTYAADRLSTATWKDVADNYFAGSNVTYDWSASGNLDKITIERFGGLSNYRYRSVINVEYGTITYAGPFIVPAEYASFYLFESEEMTHVWLLQLSGCFGNTNPATLPEETTETIGSEQEKAQFTYAFDDKGYITNITISSANWRLPSMYSFEWE